jgi:NADH dehydrogenase FAD-containing subunit
VNGRDAVVVAGGGFTGIEAATEIHSKTKARDAADDMGKRAAAQRTRLLA